jgi:hypothetical protein
MRAIGRGSIIALIAAYLPIVIGVPLLLAVTLPCAAYAMHRLLRNRRKEGTVTDGAIAHQRKRRAIVVVAALVVFAIGPVIDALPSEATHDEYWMLFVAPSMIALMVGAIALPMLVWSYLPRRAEPDGGIS